MLPHEFAVRRDRHFVTGTARTAAGAFGDNKQHHRLAASQAFGDELPKFEFTYVTKEFYRRAAQHGTQLDKSVSSLAFQNYLRKDSSKPFPA